jgi:hypothetical protein
MGKIKKVAEALKKVKQNLFPKEGQGRLGDFPNQTADFSSMTPAQKAKIKKAAGNTFGATGAGLTAYGAASSISDNKKKKKYTPSNRQAKKGFGIEKK